MIKAVIFDMFETLVTHYRGHWGRFFLTQKRRRFIGCQERQDKEVLRVILT
jgi:FMN phosphatase YigB (HAD superfamily)